jgi:RsmE family RNA methyltransferase
LNLILLLEEDFTSANRVRLSGRRREHVIEVHRAKVDDELTVGRLNGPMGKGRITRLDSECLEMEVLLDAPPPSKLPLTLILALPRPKVLNRVIASATSLGVSSIHLVNAWRVEKAYWNSPRLQPENLWTQRVLGLEQAKDTVLPDLHLHRLLRPFAEDTLPALIQDTLPLIAHPGAPSACPRAIERPVTLAVGPEGGFIEGEVSMFERTGFQPVSMGERILRVETAVAALIARLF